MSRVTGFLKKYWPTICIFLGFIFLYKYISDNGLFSKVLFPPIETIGESFVQNKETMFKNLLASLQLSVPAIVISLAISLALGVLMGLNERAREILHPVIYFISVIPAVLLTPFALLLAPSFRAASLFVIVFGSIWSTLFATITGIMSIDRRYLDKAATLELKGMKKFIKVILPAASPSILSGFNSSLRGAFVMLAYSEMYGTQYGMGFFVKKNAEYALYNNTWSGFLFMALVLVTIMLIYEQVKKYLLKWTI